MKTCILLLCRDDCCMAMHMSIDVNALSYARLLYCSD